MKVRIDPEMFDRFDKVFGVATLNGKEDTHYLNSNRTMGIPRFWDKEKYMEFGLCTLMKPQETWTRLVGPPRVAVHGWGKVYFDLRYIFYAMWCVGRRKSAVFGTYNLKSQDWSILTISHGEKRILLAPRLTEELEKLDRVRYPEWRDVFDRSPDKLASLQVWCKL